MPPDAHAGCCELHNDTCTDIEEASCMSCPTWVKFDRERPEPGAVQERAVIDNVHDELLCMIGDLAASKLNEKYGYIAVRDAEIMGTVAAAAVAMILAHPDVVLRALGAVPVTAEPTDHSPTLAMTQHVQAADIIANAVAHQQFFDAWWIPRGNWHERTTP